MADFFRKERDNLFEERFKKGKASGEWVYTGSEKLIFRAKKGGRDVNVKAPTTGTAVKVTCTATVSCSILFSYKLGAKAYSVTLSEGQLASILIKESMLRKKYPIIGLATAELCRLHATASTNSPLISGCAVDNFQASSAYPGRKFHLKLKSSRTPFANPAVSGNEKEYFLVRQVTAADCEKVLYLGKTEETLDIEIKP